MLSNKRRRRKCFAKIAERKSTIKRRFAFIAACRPRRSVKKKEKANGFGIAGFVVSLVSLWLGSYYCIASIVGLVLSIIGMSKSKVCGKCNGLAVAGLVIGIISLVIWGIIWIIVGGAIIGIASNL